MASKTCIIAIFAAFVLASRGADAVAVTALGESQAVVGGQATTLTYLDTPLLELTITTSADADVTLSAVAALTHEVPEGFSSIAFGASLGFTLEVSGDATVVDASLKTPALSAAVFASLSSTVQARCVRWDANAEAYTTVTVEEVNAQQQVVIDLPTAGLYVVASANIDVPLPALYLEARATSSTSATFSYPGGFELEVSTDTDNEVTVDFSDDSNHDDNEGTVALGAYFDIELAVGSSADATLRYEYDSSISASTAARLRFAYWDETSGESGAWVFLETGASVDVDAHVVSQTTTHFSEWGVFEDNNAESSVETTLGVAADVEGGAAVGVTFTDAPGLELLVWLDSDGTVTLSADASLSASLPGGYNGISFGANVGYTFEVGGGAELVSARLTTPALSASVVAAITGTVEARCVRFDAEANAYTGVDIDSMTLENKIVIDLPKVGLYAFATVDITVPLPTLYLEARATSSTSASFSYPGGFVLDVATQSDNEVTVDFSEESDRPAAENRTSYDAFFNIELENEEEVDATLQYEFDASIEADVAASLRFAYWDEDESAWVFLESGASVDVEARIVSQTTTHFSEWGVYGDEGTGSSGSGSAASALTVALAALAVVASAAVATF